MKEAKTDPKGIIYVRVSSEEQVAGTSLDHQEQECRKYCESNGVKIIKVYREEGASAKSAERKQFLRAIEYCRERKKRGGIDYFIVHKCDRFARNVEDHYSVRRKLLDYGTQLYSVTEPIDDSPQGKVFEAMLSAFAEFDNSIRRQRCMDGMSSRINDGIYPWKPPLGYATQHTKRRGKKKEKPDSPDPDIFPIIQRGLKKFAEGKYDYIHQFKSDLDEWGLATVRGRKTSSQIVHRTLNEYLLFYSGIIHNPFTGKNMRGKHEPMITEEEYDRIQFYLKKKRTQPESKTVFNNEFILRQFVCCASCSKGLTGSYSKGRNRKYAYYHCHNRKCKEYGKTIPTKKLEDSFEQLLNTITPTKGFWRGFKRDTLASWEQQKGLYELSVEQHEKTISNYKKQLERLSDGYVNGLFTEDYYTDKKEKIENVMMQQKIQCNEYSIEKVNMSLLLKTAERYSNSMLYMWRDLLRPGQRKVFLKFVFKAPVLYHRETGSWNHSLAEIFSIYADYTGKGSGEDVNSPLVHPTEAPWNQIVENLRVLEEVGDEFPPLRMAA